LKLPQLTRYQDASNDKLQLLTSAASLFFGDFSVFQFHHPQNKEHTKLNTNPQNYINFKTPVVNWTQDQNK
jgi:hypothetical protein